MSNVISGKVADILDVPVINELEAQRGKKITSDVADTLIAKAQAIIAELSGGT